MPTTAYTTDRNLNNVRRVPRSFLESASHEVDWRNTQVDLYLDEIRLENIQQMPALPSWEDDYFVENLYLHRLGVLSAESEIEKILSWLDNLRSDPNPRMRCHFKALLMANRDNEEIAENMGVTTLHVEYYEKLFFDVRPLKGIHQRANVVRPFTPAKNDEERMETFLLSVAIHGTPEDLDAILNDDQIPSAETRSRLEQYICNNLTIKGYAATVLKSFSPPDHTDMELFLKLLKRTGRRKRGDGGQAEEAVSDAQWQHGMINTFLGESRK
jgi:hypothetical protein